MLRERKEFNTIQVGRISSRAEAKRQMVLRTRLERALFTNLRKLLKKWVNVQMFLFRRYGIYEANIAAQNLNQDLLPLIQDHFKKVFLVIYQHNEDRHYSEKSEAMVFGRNQEIDRLVAMYFSNRVLFFEGMSANLANKIQLIIEDGLYGGMPLENIANLVSKETAVIARSRAATIARTETHGAASYANHQYYIQAQRDLGMQLNKRWLSTQDERTRPHHAAANGQIRDMNEKFDIGGARMDYAGDPAGGAKNVINCRCNVLYSDERDIVT